MDFQGGAPEARVFQQLRHFSPVIARNLLHIEAVEGHAVVFSLVEDGLPTQAHLCSFQNQELKERAVIVDGHAPFFIVIANHQVAPRPCATNWRFIGVVPTSHKGDYRMLRSRRALSRLWPSIKRRAYRGTKTPPPQSHASAKVPQRLPTRFFFWPPRIQQSYHLPGRTRNSHLPLQNDFLRA